MPLTSSKKAFFLFLFKLKPVADSGTQQGPLRPQLVFPGLGFWAVSERQQADGLILVKGVYQGASHHAGQVFPFPSALRHLEMTLPQAWTGEHCALAVVGSGLEVSEQGLAVLPSFPSNKVRLL